MANFSVAAYLPEWRYEGAHWADIASVVTHLILFSIEVTPTGALAALDRLPRAELLQEARAARDASGSRLLLCVGGNGRSPAGAMVGVMDGNGLVNRTRVLQTCRADGLLLKPDRPALAVDACFLTAAPLSSSHFSSAHRPNDEFDITSASDSRHNEPPAITIGFDLVGRTRHIFDGGV